MLKRRNGEGAIYMEGDGATWVQLPANPDGHRLRRRVPSGVDPVDLKRQLEAKRASGRDALCDVGTSVMRDRGRRKGHGKATPIVENSLDNHIRGRATMGKWRNGEGTIYTEREGATWVQLPANPNGHRLRKKVPSGVDPIDFKRQLEAERVAGRDTSCDVDTWGMCDRRKGRDKTRPVVENSINNYIEGEDTNGQATRRRGDDLHRQEW